MHPLFYPILEGLSVVLVSSLKFFVGLVNATVLFDLGFIPSVLLTVGGGMAGVFIFAYLDKLLVNLWYKITGKERATKVKFNRSRRFMIRIRSKYGLAGIALLTPILLQVPVGTILAMRLIKDVRKVSLYMLVSFTLFSLIDCGQYYSFGFQVKDFLLTALHR